MSRRLLFASVLIVLVALGTWAYRADFIDGFADGFSERVGLIGEDPELLFVHEVHPLLQEQCLTCHGHKPEDLEGGLDLRTRAALLEGGNSGEPAIVPGDAEASNLYLAVTRRHEEYQMPPKESNALSEAQTELIRRWIEGGAPWPDEARRKALLARGGYEYSDGIQVKTSGAESEAWAMRRYRPENLWAFRPVQRPEVPLPLVDRFGAAVDRVIGREPRRSVHAVDAFIEARLREEGFDVAPAADRLTLIRRATYDLHGLPPTPAEIQAFLADRSPEAFEKVIDRLLASPRYGEQWARHWLDVTRYADTGGFSNDFERPNAWRYRDYVVRSFNADKPYDRFILEQVAGDELDPADPEMLVATGFLRMGPWEHTGMSVAAETRQMFLDDVTNSVGETFLSLPLHCARCHDHKFDPIPTRDYYQIQAVFAPVQFAERSAPFLEEENRSGFTAGRERERGRLEEVKESLAALEAKSENALRRWYADRGLPYVPRRERYSLPEDQQPPRFIGLTNQELGVRKAYQKWEDLLSLHVDRYEPLAFSVYNGPPVKSPTRGRSPPMPADPGGEPQPTFILGGGSVYAPGDEVRPGVLSAVHSLAGEELGPAPRITDDLDGRRLAFARWLTDRDNPLVTRSIVNRVWQSHFGQGLAGTPNNFGAMGKKPTHPELLDWLTLELVENGWSLKRLHRLIMTSDAYQRAAEHPEIERLREKDPDNQLLAYFAPRRLTAEELRDAMLYASGELNLEMGGVPAFDEISQEVGLQPRHIMGSVALAHQPSPTPAERNRRSLYLYRYRGLPNPMLEVFNQPSTDLSCERRDASTVTPQVFALFNGQNSHDMALGLARRVEREAGESLRDRIERAMFLAWQRPARADEVEKAVEFVRTMEASHRAESPRPRSYPTQVTRKMFEEMTGESFEFTERLDVYENYEPDPERAHVGPTTRALADLALVLFNANEFVYVY